MQRDDYAVRNQQVCDVIRERIILGQIAPGQQISEKALARDIGCSIVPVREALSRLVAWGVLRKVPHRGTFARELTPQELVDHSDLRLILYTYAVGRCAIHPDPASLASLEATLAVFENHLRSGIDRQSAMMQNDEWLEYINVAVGNLLRAYEAIVHTARLDSHATTFQQEDLIYILSTRHFWNTLPRESMLAYIEQSFLKRPLSCFLPAVKAGDAREAQRLHRNQFRAMIQDFLSRVESVGVDLPQSETSVLADVRFEFHPSKSDTDL